MAPVNGTQLYYERIGSGPPVVLIPPESGDRRVWDEQITAFSRHFDVVRYDLRGFGKSARTAGVYRHAEDLFALLEWLGVERAMLVGFQWGANIALELALDHPERVRALVLVSSLLRGFVPTRSPEGVALAEGIRTATSEPNTAKRLMKLSRAITQAAPARPKDIGVPPAVERQRRVAHRRMAAMQLSNLPRVLSLFLTSPLDPEHRGRFIDPWGRAYRARWLDPPAVQRLGEIMPPTLIVLGEQLPSISLEIAEVLHTGIAHAELAMIPAAGYWVQLEDPMGFNEVVLRFLESAREIQGTDNSAAP